MDSVDGIWYQSTLQRTSYSKCQGKFRIAATSLSNFFDDCYMLKEKYFHSGRIGTGETKMALKEIHKHYELSSCALTMD